MSFMSMIYYPKQECIPVGCVPPAHWPYLIISYACSLQPRMPPTITHAPRNHACPPQPCTPPHNHASPHTTMHAPPHNHACLPQPRMPPHNHACPPVDRITDACKKITFPLLRLRAVNIGTSHSNNIIVFTRYKFDWHPCNLPLYS